MSFTTRILKNLTNLRKHLFFIGVIFLFSAQVSMAQLTPYKAQALFIYNFTKHIKWPSSTDESFVIGVLGRSEMINELNTSLKGKQVEGKNIVVISILSPSEATQCKLLYVPDSKSKEIASIISSINNQDVLIVTEGDLSDKGACISFVTKEEKLRFKVNQEALSKNGLQISGGLVSLAVR